MYQQIVTLTSTSDPLFKAVVELHARNLSSGYEEADSLSQEWIRMNAEYSLGSALGCDTSFLSLLIINGQPAGYSLGLGFRDFPKKIASSYRKIIETARELLGEELDNSFYSAGTGIEEKWRRLGLGKLLITEKVEATQENGFQCLVVDTNNPLITKIYNQILGVPVHTRELNGIEEKLLIYKCKE